MEYQTTKRIVTGRTVINKGELVTRDGEPTHPLLANMANFRTGDGRVVTLPTDKLGNWLIRV